MKSILSFAVPVVLLALSYVGVNAQAIPIYQEDFSSGWEYGETISGQNTAWAIGNSSYNDDITIEQGLPSYLSYIAGGTSKSLYYTGDHAISNDMTYVFSALIRSDAIGAATTGTRGMLDIRLQATGGATLGSFVISALNGSNSAIYFAAGNGANSAVATDALTLSEALAPETWYRMTLTLLVESNTVGFTFHNHETDALLVSASGTLAGLSIDPTLIRGFGFFSGTFASELAPFQVADISLTAAIPEPGAVGMLGAFFPLAWMVSRWRKWQGVTAGVTALSTLLMTVPGSYAEEQGVEFAPGELNPGVLPGQSRLWYLDGGTAGEAAYTVESGEEELELAIRQSERGVRLALILDRHTAYQDGSNCLEIVFKASEEMPKDLIVNLFADRGVIQVASLKLSPDGKMTLYRGGNYNDPEELTLRTRPDAWNHLEIAAFPESGEVVIRLGDEGGEVTVPLRREGLEASMPWWTLHLSQSAISDVPWMVRSIALRTRSR